MCIQTTWRLIKHRFYFSGLWHKPRESAFLGSLQVMPLLLVQGPHFELKLPRVYFIYYIVATMHIQQKEKSWIRMTSVAQVGHSDSFCSTWNICDKHKLMWEDGILNIFSSGLVTIFFFFWKWIQYISGPWTLYNWIPKLFRKSLFSIYYLQELLENPCQWIVKRTSLTTSSGNTENPKIEVNEV